MDATQMICDSILESDEEKENGNARAEPLATLRVLKNKHIPETVLPLYLGENVLGRDPTTCTLPLRAQSVSKQHTAVSITTFHASSGRAAASIEALVWDMGSMNGTRKGRLKLTPHVRYALSEGDTLLVADIPCQYTSCGVSGGPGNTDSVVAGESQGTGGDDEEVHANGNAEAPAARALLGKRGETTMETPATTKALSFEKTPTQPECSLVPESDSDSDGEQGRRGRWRKTLVSESDSHVSNPTCSTFLSPTNKIIPESEDESPITPMSSSKHRLVGCVGAQEAEQDVDTWQQQLKNQKGAPVISTDSEEGELGKRGDCASGKPVNGVSPGAEEESDRPGRMLSTEPIPVLNMDSGSDVEGEEESSVSARDPVTPSRTPPLPANAPTSQLGQFHMDSDTDAEDEDDGTPAPKAGGANATEPPGDLLVAQQTDSDSDVDGGDDDDKLDGVVTKETHASAQSENTPGSSAPFTQPADFNLESDTDVEEEEEGDDSMTKRSSAKIEAESRQVEVASAALPNFDLDSDTDDEVLPAGASEASAHTTPADAAAQLEILSDSDTDVEEDSPPIPPFVAAATNAGLMSSTPSRGPISLSAALGPDSDADTDVDEASPVGVDSANFRMDSDTDVEDEQEEEAGAEGTVGGQESGSSGEKDFGSLQGHRASLQQWSTPAQGGVVAEMETQEYLSPSTDPFKCPRTPAPRFMVSSSCSDSQGEDDFVVAETQSFIVDNRDQQQASPSGSYTLDEGQPFIPQGASTQEEDEGGANGGDSSFQLGLSDSVHLQHPQAQALATEATQAFVLSDGDMNLEATQVYPTGSSLELQATQVYPTGSSLELQATQVYPTGSSLELQATQVYPTTTSVDGSALEMVSEQDETQSYVGSAGSSRPAAGSRINRQGDFALEETQAYIPESHIDEDVEEEDEAEEATAETQPMCKLLGEYNAVETQPLPLDKGERERHDGGEQVDGEETPSVEAGTTRSLSVAETQPMATSKAEESNDDEDSVVAPRKRTARRLVEEEDSQVMAGSEPPAAEIRPVLSTSTDESTDKEDTPPGRKQMRSRSQRKSEGAASARTTATATTEPVVSSRVRPRRGKGGKAGPPTSRGAREEKEEEEEEKVQVPPASLRSTRSMGKASSSTRAGAGFAGPGEQRGAVEEGEKEEEGEQVRQGMRRRTRQPRENAREKKARLERERKEQEENERILKEREEQERMERALREEEEKQGIEKEEREREERERERLEHEKEERERLEMKERERIERERKAQEEKERLERIQREKEELKRLECKKKEREERERLETEEKERVERERKAQEERDSLEQEREEREREEQERLEKERKEIEERERLEKERKELEEQERLEKERKELEERERLEKERKELEEQERLEKERKELEEQERLEKERKELEEQERLEKERKELEERERLEKERKELEEQERLEKEIKELEEQERLEKERKERERLEKEKRELEEQERLEKERKEREERERFERIQKEKEEQVEKERLEREENERKRKELEEIERLESERKEQEERERLEQIQREEEERTEKERTQRQRKELEDKGRLKTEQSEREMERLRREKAERQQKEEGEQAKLEAESREREETERQDDDEGERLTKEALEKRLQVEAQAQSGEQTSLTARGRRATRRTAGAPSEPDPAKDDGPATRTRSRSNSSNSVSSERSASRAATPESGGGRGRGRGATQSHPPVVGATRESKRRRTTAGEMTPNEALGRGTRSRSNSNDSLNMDISTCSSSQSRDRGSRGAGRGRGRGRGRKTLPAKATSSSGQNEPCSAPKATARGRKSTRLEATAVEGSQGGGEEKPASQQSATTSGHPQTNATNSGALIVEEQDEEETLVTSSTTGRGKGRKAQKKCEPVETLVDDADGVEHHGRGSARRTREQESERREETPKRGSAVQGRRKLNEPQIQEVVKEEQEETIERKVRGGRQLVAKKKNKEEDEEVSAPSVTEQDAVTLQVTQTGKSSRKRGAAPVEASPMAKSPRASGASPGSRLPAAGQPCKVLFTGMVDEVGEEVVVRLGGSLALDVSDMTHLVTDKVRRTVKFLCAVARGIPVVTTQWLEKSGKARSFLSPSEFIVKDAETEKKFNFSLQESISIASNQPLLQGYQIHVTKSVKPEPIHMKEIISCCGASFLAKMPSSYKEQTVVVSCEEDWSRCGPAVAACLPVVSAEFILTGILQQKADTEAHALRRPVPAPTTTPTQPVRARGRGQKRT